MTLYGKSQNFALMEKHLANERKLKAQRAYIEEYMARQPEGGVDMNVDYSSNVGQADTVPIWHYQEVKRSLEKMQVRAETLAGAAGTFSLPLKEIYAVLRCIAVEDDPEKMKRMVVDLVSDVKSHMTKVDVMRDDINKRMLSGEL